MSATAEFHYRLPERVSGLRPGAHAGSSQGPGMAFVGHQRLQDCPDPRRLDIRASLRDPRGDWLVRVARQRTAVPVWLIADVSASMAFGAPSKLEVVAELAAAIGRSAFRAGDAAGLIAFDRGERADCYRPPSLSRGAGDRLAAPLRALAATAQPAPDGRGVIEALQRLAGRTALVFLASDFHWPLTVMDEAWGLLRRACVVPVIVWDPAELVPPAQDGLLRLRDVERDQQRRLWLRPTLRRRWQQAIDERRNTLRRYFAAQGLRPFFTSGAFDAEAMSQYFLEGGP